MNFEKLFKDIANIKVLVVGDVMLDTYLFGKVERISPEAPVPVVTVTEKQYRIGGAGNVALNTVSLGATTYVASVIGSDEDGKRLIELYQQHNINTDFISLSSKRTTTNKARVISNSQQMIRLDTEVIHDISTEEEKILLQNIEQCILQLQPNLLVFEDYDKGVLTQSVITQTIALCQQHHIITTVDPKRKHFFFYHGVDMFKPNLKEVKEGLNVALESVNAQSLQNIHQLLKEKLNHHISLITLSEKGIFFQQNDESAIISTHIRSIADVSGAGDTVIAVASLVYATTSNIKLAAEMANIAGGLVCEEVGTVAINKEKLFKECVALLN